MLRTLRNAGSPLRRPLTRLVPCIALAAALMAAAPAAGDEPPPNADQIRHWISELSDDNFAVRQMAADRLLTGGFAARAALAEVADGPDPEVRAAARRLVTLIDQSEFSRQLADFAADVDGKRGITLPGWERYRDLVGSDEAARMLFVDMQRDEAALLAQMFREPSANGAQNGLASSPNIPWEERISRLTNVPMAGRRSTRAPLGSSATMFFLGSIEESRMSDAAAIYLMRLAKSPTMNEALRPRQGQPAVRRVVSAWLVNCPSRHEEALIERLNLMMLYSLEDALPLAVGIAQCDARYPLVEPSRRAFAIQMVGRFGSEDDAAALEPLLSDATEILPRSAVNVAPATSYSVQLRDVALATMVHLTGQDVKDYGFAQARRHPQTVFDASSLGFESDERRAAAAAHWQAWKADHRPDDATSR